MTNLPIGIIGISLCAFFIFKAFSYYKMKTEMDEARDKEIKKNNQPKYKRKLNYVR